MLPLLLAALPAVMGALNKGGSGGGAAPAGGGGGLPGIPGIPGIPGGNATSGDATSGIGPVAVSYGPAVGNGGGSATATQTQPAPSPAAPQSSLPYVVPVAAGGMESQTLIIAGGFGLLAIILLLRK